MEKLMNVEPEMMKTLLTDTIFMMCRNGLLFRHQLKIQGLLAVTVDDEIFVVQMNEHFQPTNDASSEDGVDLDNYYNISKDGLEINGKYGKKDERLKNSKYRQNNNNNISIKNNTKTYNTNHHHHDTTNNNSNDNLINNNNNNDIINNNTNSIEIIPIDSIKSEPRLVNGNEPQNPDIVDRLDVGNNSESNIYAEEFFAKLNNNEGRPYQEYNDTFDADASILSTTSTQSACSRDNQQQQQQLSPQNTNNNNMIHDNSPNNNNNNNNIHGNNDIHSNNDISNNLNNNSNNSYDDNGNHAIIINGNNSTNNINNDNSNNNNNYVGHNDTTINNNNNNDSIIDNESTSLEEKLNFNDVETFCRSIYDNNNACYPSNNDNGYHNNDINYTNNDYHSNNSYHNYHHHNNNNNNTFSSSSSSASLSNTTLTTLMSNSTSKIKGQKKDIFDYDENGHRLKSFVCQYQGCTKAFFRKDHLTRHQRIKHGKPFGADVQNIYKCCGKTFYKQRSLIKHRLENHPGEKDTSVMVVVRGDEVVMADDNVGCE